MVSGAINYSWILGNNSYPSYAGDSTIVTQKSDIYMSRIITRGLLESSGGFVNWEDLIVSLMSRYLAQAREGHLNQVLHIFAYCYWWSGLLNS